jgi:hypothetical protein
MEWKISEISMAQSVTGIDRERWGLFVNRGIGNTGEQERLTALDAGAADPAMDFAALVAGPRFRKINTEFRSPPGDSGLVGVNEGTEQFHLGVGAFLHGLAHALHELFAAIRVNGVVSRVGGDHQSFCFNAFRISGGNRQHDTIAERDHGFLHGFLGVMPFRYVAAGLEEVRFEQFVHESQGNRVVGDAPPLGMEAGERDFTVVVLRSVIERKAPHHLVVEQGVVKNGDGIHSAAEENTNFHGIVRNRHMMPIFCPKSMPFR